MGAVLRVEWLRVMDRRGNWQDRYDLDGRLVAIVGPIDRGKTSMVDCLGYLFGREIKFKTAVVNHVLEVQAQLRIGDGRFRLSRAVVAEEAKQKAVPVRVEDEQGNPVQDLPLLGTEPHEQTLSDWLLEQLGLVEMFASVRLSREHRLDFAADLLPYLHIRQENIGRWVIRENRGGSGDARLVVLKLLLSLTSKDYERRKADLAASRSKIKEERRRLSAIENFLKDEPDPAELDGEAKRLRSEESAAQARLESLRARASSTADMTTEAQAQLANARKRLMDVEVVHQRALEEQHRIDQQVAELDAALAKIYEAAEGGSDELALGFTTCPVCRTDLSTRTEEHGRCGLCTEPLPASALAAQQSHLEAKRKHVLAAQADAVLAVRRTEGELSGLRREVAEKAAHLDRCTQQHVSPYVDGIAAAAADLEAIRGRIAVLDQKQEPHRELGRRRASLEELKSEQDGIKRKLRQANTGIADLQHVLAHLNGLFSALVEKLKLPWATGRAWFDERTLLPMVDEQEFGRRGGGSSAAVSVAYSLTLLKHALENPGGSALPTLLIVDSPQRDLGKNDHDTGLGERIYAGIADYLADHSNQRRNTDRFDDVQLIIVDNSLPKHLSDRFDRVVTFDERSGFVRGLRDPHGAPAASSTGVLSSAEAVFLDGGEE